MLGKNNMVEVIKNIGVQISGGINNLFFVQKDDKSDQVFPIEYYEDMFDILSKDG